MAFDSETSAVLARLYSMLVSSPVAFLKGSPGTGKTTMAHILAARGLPLFPGGIVFLDSRSDIFRQLIALEESASRTGKILVILDDADQHRVWVLRRVILWAMNSELVRLLVVARSAGELDKYPSVPSLRMLEGRGDAFKDYFEQRQKRGGHNESQLARPYFRSGLLDPRGQMLSPKSEGGQRLILDARAANKALLSELSRTPDIAHSLPSRRWEELVAHLFSELGYSVELTPASKDGGRDIQIIRKDHLGSAIIFVECKKYARDRPVGVEIVRQLYGTVTSENATQGVLVTTSHFTSGARILERQHERRLSLTDYQQFLGWLRNSGY